MPKCAKANCPYTFIFDRKKCVSKITKGCNPLPFVAPEATHFINPELDDVPKQKINLNAIGIVSEPVKNLFAYNHKRAMVTAHDKVHNRIYDDWVTIPIPLYENIRKDKAFTGKGAKVINAMTGEELHMDPGEIKYHGMEDKP